MSAELLANRIPPDIASDIFNAIRRPKNVVVIAYFPERATARFAEFEGGALFEQADEFAQVAVVMRSLRKNVKVIGHQAKRVQAKRMGGGALQQQSEDALGSGLFAEIGNAVVAADCDEIGLTPEIVLRCKAGDAAVDGHTRA